MYLERGGVKRCEKAKNKEPPPATRASEKEEASGACRRPEPSAAESDCTKPARACGTHSEWSVRLEHIVTAKKRIGARPPTSAPRALSTESGRQDATEAKKRRMRKAYTNRK